MSDKIPNEGEIRQLTELKNMANQRVILFKNDYTPVDGTTFANLTEADFSNYSRQTPTWGAISTNGSGEAEMAASAVVFSHDGGATGNNVYGWALIDAAVGAEKVLAAARLSSPPKSMTLSGDSITVTLTHRLRQKP